MIYLLYTIHIIVCLFLWTVGYRQMQQRAA
mgnify:CR=1 FL=1